MFLNGKYYNMKINYRECSCGFWLQQINMEEKLGNLQKVTDFYEGTYEDILESNKQFKPLRSTKPDSGPVDPLKIVGKVAGTLPNSVLRKRFEEDTSLRYPSDPMAIVGRVRGVPPSQDQGPKQKKEMRAALRKRAYLFKKMREAKIRKSSDKRLVMIKAAKKSKTMQKALREEKAKSKVEKKVKSPTKTATVKAFQQRAKLGKRKVKPPQAATASVKEDSMIYQEFKQAVLGVL